MRNSPGQRGFTLLEMLAVVTLMGIVAAIVLPRIRNMSGEAKGVTCDAIHAELNVAAQLWFHKHGRWPALDFRDMANDDDLLPDGLPVCPVDGQAYQFDAVRRRVQPHSH